MIVRLLCYLRTYSAAGCNSRLVGTEFIDRDIGKCYRAGFRQAFYKLQWVSCGHNLRQSMYSNGKCEGSADIVTDISDGECFPNQITGYSFSWTFDSYSCAQSSSMLVVAGVIVVILALLAAAALWRYRSQSKREIGHSAQLKDNAVSSGSSLTIQSKELSEKSTLLPSRIDKPEYLPL